MYCAIILFGDGLTIYRKLVERVAKAGFAGLIMLFMRTNIDITCGSAI